MCGGYICDKAHFVRNADVFPLAKGPTTECDATDPKVQQPQLTGRVCVAIKFCVSSVTFELIQLLRQA